MREARKTTLFVLIVLAAFLAGYWLQRSAPGGAARRILYYRDPMHPAYRSDKPGIAPDCGMQLEPVYLDGGSGSGAPADLMAPGAVRIDPRRQQIIGLRTAPVTRSSGHHVIRVPGRIAADETRVYRVSAGSDGLIQVTSTAAVGDTVRANDLLATAYTREVLTAQQSYINSLMALESGAGAGLTVPGTHKMKNMPIPADADKSNPQLQQLSYLQMQLRLAEDQLRNFGVSDLQMTELGRSRLANGIVEFRAPASGVVLFRNVNAGQRIDRGTELFRIADLAHLWVLADLFESDGGAIHAGSPARVRYQGRTIAARMSSALPQLDPASRALRARLEIDNVSSRLSPGMFVEVEFDVREPDGIAVPADAILDTGQHKIVFVSPREGVFEPREVTTGARYGDRVQIVKGLAAGEQLVVSGLFLLDSESRLQLAAAAAGMPTGHPNQASPASQASETDPVCGMPIAPSAAQSHLIYEGVTYYFCSESCRRSFDQAPSTYASKAKAAASRSRP
jgi:multidrug efflux pump subunit AcrA (membrane-fusion protein)/YHS domain-containing protein